MSNTTPLLSGEELTARQALLLDIASLPQPSLQPETGSSILQRVIHELGEFHPAVPPYYCVPIKNVCTHWANQIGRALISIKLLVEREQYQWQPIETAPEDVELLLGWWQMWPEPEWNRCISMARDTRGGWRHGQATHWMTTTPAPPITSGDSTHER